MLHDTTPPTSASSAPTRPKSRTRLIGPPERAPPATAAMMIATASPRSCSAAPATAAAGCSRRSDIVERARELRDPRAHELGLGLAQRRNLRLAGRGVERHRGEPEHALQRSLLGVDVLHAPDRHDRALDDERAVADVDLLP